MEIQRKVKVQEWDDSEASWSSGNLSTNLTPKFTFTELNQPGLTGFKKTMADLFLAASPTSKAKAKKARSSKAKPRPRKK
jgi:hypothetical protein